MKSWMMRNNKYLPVYMLVLALTLRIFLININAAEWGDSYRILRASNFIRELTYPSDEKRPPFFSALLAIRPPGVDAILWGQMFMLTVSIASMFVFYNLSQKLLSTQKQRLLAVGLLFLNPVYLYWSLRIYADVPFSLLVMLCFYIFELWRERLSVHGTSLIFYPSVMGIICGLSILTRFEGYFLAAAVGVGVLILSTGSFKKRIKPSLIFLFSMMVVVIPWLIYRNPLTSSYFEEPAGREYDLNMFLTYLISYLFVLGIIPAASFIVPYMNRKFRPGIPKVFKRYPHIIVFILLESLIIMAWPAAVPRLFVPVIPIFVIAFVRSFEQLERRDLSKLMGVASVVFTASYVFLQHKLRLQFLGPHTLVFISISVISAIATLSVFVKSNWIFLVCAFLSMGILSMSTIYMHKDIYRSIKEISVFSLRESRGKTIHNDTAGIVNWYLPGSEYKNLDDKKYLTAGYLAENQIGYVILTNEFNPDMEIDLKKRPYLSLRKASEYVRGGKMFYTWLVKVEK